MPSLIRKLLGRCLIKMRFRCRRDIKEAIFVFASVGFVVMTATLVLQSHDERYVVTYQGYTFSSVAVTQKPNVTRRNNVTFISETPEFRKYVTLRQTRVNRNHYTFLMASKAVCTEPPYLLIVCLSKIANVAERSAIRETWGNWTLTSDSGHQSVKLVFIFGSPGNSMERRRVAVKERKQYQDIVMADFVDSYENLTLKVLSILRWTAKNCNGAKFLMKVDDDTFVHVPNLLSYLRTLNVPEHGIIVGHGEFKHHVLRAGRWALPRDVYPLDEYPPYVSGNSYVISGNIVSRLLNSSQYLPFIFLEDVFITGILREAIGAEMRHRVGFTWWAEHAPRLCGFHNNVRISATNTDVHLARRLWRALGFKLTNCYDPSTLLKLEYVNHLETLKIENTKQTALVLPPQ